MRIRIREFIHIAAGLSSILVALVLIGAGVIYRDDIIAVSLWMMHNPMISSVVIGLALLGIYLVRSGLSLTSLQGLSRFHVTEDLITQALDSDSGVEFRIRVRELEEHVSDCSRCRKRWSRQVETLREIPEPRAYVWDPTNFR